MKSYYEIRPGLDALRYLASFGTLELLARRAAARRQRLFVGISSSMDRHVLSEGIFEKGVINLVRDLCAATGHTDLMIDIGANIGNHTVALASMFKNVESVEPHPVLFRVLEANVLQNQLAHVRCHNFGLASEDTTGTLAESSVEHGLSRVLGRSQLSSEVFGLPAEDFGKQYAVQLRSAHDFVANFADRLNKTFIKIDVEGMEQEIVTALLPILKQYRPILGFEWFTASQPELLQIVGDLAGYELWVIRVHDTGRNRAWRALKMLFKGRFYTLERVNLKNLDKVYPLAVLIPAGVSLSAFIGSAT